ncbi:Pnap_2097 family protein [Shinella sp.]|uniref:Pnap_2097 family protein n=1 Tax=Shinella sp. TaxID=1870904 RepID=UPI003F72C030
MNLAIFPEAIRAPTARLLMERALEPHLLIGMPHLTPDGLSETWLMKELGHRHWLMLARDLGMDDADFRTPDGAEAYAAFCATALSNADFAAVEANDVLTIRSTLHPVGRTQTLTRHHLSCGERPIGTVELLSLFVTRSRAGDNRSIMRTALSNRRSAAGVESTLAKTAAALRAGTLRSHFDLATDSAPLSSHRFQPDRLPEFNGAGLFYCVEFQTIASRALASWRPAEDRTIGDRDVFFFGNIDAGETIEAELAAETPNSPTQLCRLKRSDGKTIGVVFSNYRAGRILR